MDGSVATYEIAGDNGAVSRRYFCAKCGSPIAIDPATMPAITFLSVGTLDDTKLGKAPGAIVVRERSILGPPLGGDPELPERHDRVTQLSQFNK